MMGRRDNGSKLFLTELMISIFFFAIIAAVCTQIFSDARIMSRKSKELAGGVNAAANVAESFEGWDGDSAKWQAIFPDGVWADSHIWYQAYDSDWQPVNKAGDYVVIMTIGSENSGAGIVRTAKITAQPYDEESDAVIYELDVARALR
jgi:hypothetical protein